MTCAAAAAAQLLHHGDAVHLRHAHVGYDKIRAVLLGGGMRLFAVRRLADNDAAHRSPVHAEGDAAADDGLVVNDQNLQHCRSLLLHRQAKLNAASLPGAARICADAVVAAVIQPHYPVNILSPRCPPGTSRSGSFSQSSTSCGMPTPLSWTLRMSVPDFRGR